MVCLTTKGLYAGEITLPCNQGLIYRDGVSLIRSYSLNGGAPCCQGLPTWMMVCLANEVLFAEWWCATLWRLMRQIVVYLAGEVLYIKGWHIQGFMILSIHAWVIMKAFIMKISCKTKHNKGIYFMKKHSFKNQSETGRFFSFVLVRWESDSRLGIYKRYMSNNNKIIQNMTVSICTGRYMG